MVVELLALVVDTAGGQSAAETVAYLARETILGATALLGLGVAFWAIVQMRKGLEQRVEDANKAAQRLEQANERDREAQAKTTESVTKLAVAVTEMGHAIDRNTQSVRETSASQVAAIGKTTEAINDILKETVRIAQRRGSSGQHVAVREPYRPPPRDPRQDE